MKARWVGALALAGAMIAGSAVAADAKADAKVGEASYKQACFSCHGTGVAGAPKLGDKANWAPRIAEGNEVMYTHAIKGFKGKVGFMPAKGGFVSMSDANVKAAVDYMVAASK